MKTFVINKNDAGQRVDKFVLKVTSSLPKSLMYKAIRLKKIKVNRKRCEFNTILQENDTVEMFLSPDFFVDPEKSFLNLKPNLRIVYEDENILICEKDEGMSCHSDEKQKTNTLIDNVKAYLYQNGKYDPEKENSFAPALCNRIDRNTTGLVVCALNAEALREMDELFRSRKIKKKYLAKAIGIFDKKKDVLTHFLKKLPEENRVLVFDGKTPGALTAITEYEVIKEDKEENTSLLEITLHTGRTHQIRAQLAHIGHPLLGDAKYGKDKNRRDFDFQALRAQSIEFCPDENSFFSYLDKKTFFASFDKRFS